MSFRLKMMGAAALIAGGLGIVGAAHAAPAGPASAAGLAGAGIVEHVAQGCGPGFARGPRGFCRPMRRGGFGARGFYGPPRAYGRRCVVRPTPFGPRRVCR
ncbi:MAG: hypothetical protein JWR08_2323 [Enterovirga sp.]|nr:hypothetical protein [Enterovirga sp.]